MKCAGHIVNLKGAWINHKSRESLDDGNLLAECKGVHREVESEGSARQNVDLTDRNRI